MSKGESCIHRWSARSVVPAAGLWLLAVALAGCDFFYPPPEQRFRAIDVYRDRYEFRFNTYTSVRRLEIALKATTDRIEELNVRDCVDDERLAEVLDVLRANGQVDVIISMPDNC